LRLIREDDDQSFLSNQCADVSLFQCYVLLSQLFRELPSNMFTEIIQNIQKPSLFLFDILQNPAAYKQQGEYSSPVTISININNRNSIQILSDSLDIDALATVIPLPQKIRGIGFIFKHDHHIRHWEFVVNDWITHALVINPAVYC